ncbi:hypothetical protein [Microbacterium sp.]|uniref:hypothetical protein n=1 Tax=Microbacterium sp. TaxID=51671 RepID=UPI003F6E94E1
MTSDVEIGRNVARVRGLVSQKDLADEMRRRGFRWSQATVWAVEKGERPLRLAEAEALGKIMDIHHTVLLYSSEGIDLVYEFRDFGDLMDEIQELAYLSFERQRRLAALVDRHPADWEEDEDSEAVLARNAVDAAIEGIVRAEAHYRGLVSGSNFPETADERASAGKFSHAFMSGIADRLEAERARLRKPQSSEKSDGVDQTT